MIDVNLLPTDRRRTSEPVYWRLSTILVPLATIATLATLHYVAWNAMQIRTMDVRNLEARVLLLQPAVDSLAEAQARRRELEILTDRADAIRTGAIRWTPHLTSLLETLPTGTSTTTTNVIDFVDVTLRTLDGPLTDPARYEGSPVAAEATISGHVATLDVLSEFLGNLERDARFGVVFQAASERMTENEILDRFAYALTVGILNDAMVEAP